jgi:hypothetical protein
VEFKPRKVVILYGGRERVAEIEHGPFKLAANDETEYYEGWLMLEGQDPYGEPLHITFAKASIKGEA